MSKFPDILSDILINRCLVPIEHILLHNLNGYLCHLTNIFLRTIDIASDCRCAITQMIFKNPVKCKTDINDKHPITYENYAIRKWLCENKLCPLKRKEIIIIEDDLEMKTNIEKLIKNNPKLLDEQFKEEVENNDLTRTLTHTEGLGNGDYVGIGHVIATYSGYNTHTEELENEDHVRIGPVIIDDIFGETFHPVHIRTHANRQISRLRNRSSGIRAATSNIKSVNFWKNFNFFKPFYLF